MSPDDALLAIDAGADAVGVILAPSPRQVSLDTLRAIVARVPAFVQTVAVLVDPEPTVVSAVLDTGAVVQFSGDELPAACDRMAPRGYIKTVHVSDDEVLDAVIADARAAVFPRATVMFDSRMGAVRGGTGRAFAWNALVDLASWRPIVVSGGLTPDNVADCVSMIRPYAVDVRSGVERNDMKDPNLVRAFVAAVRSADARA